MFPYSKPRTGQISVAEKVANTISSGGCLCIEAPTGFGKTVAVLYGVKLAGSPNTLYLVRTRNELVQPLIESLKIGLKPVFLYSKKAMCPLLRGGSIDIHDFWENCRILRKTKMCPYYVNTEELDVESVYKFIERLQNPFKIVRELSKRGYCPFYSLKKLLPLSNIIILTYPYVLNPSIREAFFSEEEISNYVVAVDEAHSLLSIADIVEQRVSRIRIERSINEIRKYSPQSTLLIDRLYHLLDFIDKASVDKRLRHVDKDFLRNLLGTPDTWFDLVDDIRIHKVKEYGYRDVVSIRVYCLPIAYLVWSLYSRYEPFIYQQNDLRYIVSKPIDQSIIVKPVFDKASSIILFSGTLPDPSYYSDVLGIDKPIEYIDVEDVYGPVFPIENRVLVIATYVSSKYSVRSRHIYKLYADMIQYTFNHLDHGIMLTVYPSYDFMKCILEYMDLDKVFIEERSTRINDVIDYCTNRKKCLVNAVAGGKLCEGIEIVDKKGRSLIKVVFIAGVPYPQPDDYVELSLKQLSLKIGRDGAWKHLYIDTAVTRTKQAIGRAVRGPSDQAVYILADNRFMDPRILKRIGLRINKIVRSRAEYMRVVKVLLREFLV